MRSTWQDSKAKFINRVVKAHDYELYAERNTDGIIVIYRRGKRYVPFMEDSDSCYYVTQESPHFVCALTHNWQTNGNPRDWGADIVVNRVKSHDLWNQEDFFKKMEETNEKVDKSKSQDFRNNAEAFFSDTHKLWKRDFSDIRTANMDKTEKKRKLREKGMEQKLKSIKEF